jgi:cytochrome P450
LLTFLMLMAKHPDIQRRAQCAIDAALEGQNRFPDANDERRIPYVDAIVKELLRWMPVAPLGAHIDLLPRY